MFKEQPQLRPLEVSDFSGGMTDNIYSGVLNRYNRAENLNITDDNKLMTRPGSDMVDTTYPSLPAVCRTLMQLNDEILYQSGRNLYHKPAGLDFQPIIGPTGFANPAYSDIAADGYASWAEWNNHLITTSNFPSKPVRVFKDGADFKVHTLGLPKYNGTPVLTGTALAAGENTYAYACHYETEYEANGVTYKERGPVTYFGESSDYAPIGGLSNVQIAPSAELASNLIDCYDKANIKIVFYRNTNAGRVWYKIGSIANDAASIVDNFTDGEIQLNEILYVDGGVLDHEPPPECRYLHQTNDICYFGAIKENGVVKENKLRMSNRFMPWSCPGAFEEEFDDNIVGISSVGIYPIVFCRNSVYRLEGFYDQLGRGTVRKKKISDGIGGVSSRSIVKPGEDGIFFAGNNGFYFCDGATVYRVSDEINETYQELIEAKKLEKIYGAYDGINKVVYWAATTVVGGEENDTIFVGHLKKLVGRHLPFTTWNGGLANSNFTAVAMTAVNDELYRADRHAFIYKHTKEKTYDRSYSAFASPADFARIPIIIDFLSICLNFGTDSVRKWVPFMTLNANNVTDLHIDIFTSNDALAEISEKQLKAVTYEGRFGWGDPNLSWGDPVILNVFPVITAKRRFPKGGIRCSFRQVRFTNARKLITDSDQNGQALVNSSDNSVFFDTYSLPEGLFGGQFSFSHDEFDEKYDVSGEFFTTYLVDNPKNTLPTGTYDWRFYAFPIDEVFNLISYSLWFAHTGPSQQVFRGEK